MKLKETIEDLLLEASKVDTLVNKLGYNEKDAQEIESLCGGLSVWIGRKIFDNQGFFTMDLYDLMIRSSIDRVNSIPSA
jgi:hypothetical protein